MRLLDARLRLLDLRIARLRITLRAAERMAEKLTWQPAGGGDYEVKAFRTYGTITGVPPAEVAGALGDAFYEHTGYEAEVTPVPVRTEQEWAEIERLLLEVEALAQDIDRRTKRSR